MIRRLISGLFCEKCCPACHATVPENNSHRVFDVPPCVYRYGALTIEAKDRNIVT
jgi:hypothetical protein